MSSAIALGRRLDSITTQWSQIANLQYFLKRYGPAARAYLAAILREPDAVDDVLQGFLLRVVQHGFGSVRPTLGRFRDYLKAALRHAVWNYRQRQRPTQALDPASVSVENNEVLADRIGLNEWRNCLLERAWAALEKHEQREPASAYYTVLRLAVTYRDEDSSQLALRASAGLGRPMTAVAFRKQLSRARRQFARYLEHEVAATLGNASRSAIDEELADLALLEYVQHYRQE
jgi:DNA-directed RNA polymerase specialized sigma24 family protein